MKIRIVKIISIIAMLFLVISIFSLFLIDRKAFSWQIESENNSSITVSMLEVTALPWNNLVVSYNGPTPPSGIMPRRLSGFSIKISDQNTTIEYVVNITDLNLPAMDPNSVHVKPGSIHWYLGEIGTSPSYEIKYKVFSENSELEGTKPILVIKAFDDVVITTLDNFTIRRSSLMSKSKR